MGFVVGAAGSSYWNVRGVGTAVIGNVPANPPPVVIVTRSPTERLCGIVVRIVAVVPTALAPGTAGVTVPPPETGRPVTGFSYVNERETGTEVIVNVPL